MPKDYLNINDEQLVVLLTAVYNHSSLNAATWNIFPDELSDWQVEFTAFKAAVTVLEDPANRVHGNYVARDDAKSALLKKVRPFIQGRLEHNSKVTAADLAFMGLPVHDSKPTPHPAPSEEPLITVKVIGERQVEVRIERKPSDAYGIKTVYSVTDQPPEDQEDLGHSVFSRKRANVLTFREAERGKPLYIAARYENAKGEGGPWSAIIKTMVP
jgi:hypothetical protein